MEGSHDAGHISSFFDTHFVLTNGYTIPEKEIDFLNSLSSDVPIYLLTDSDKAGRNINDSLKNKLNHFIELEVDVNKCGKKGKHGVAECEKEELLRVLSPYSSKKSQYNIIDPITLFEIGINGKSNSKFTKLELATHFNLGLVNNKNMLYRLAVKNITIKEIKEYLSYGN